MSEDTLGNLKKRFQIDEGILILLLILSLTGVIIIDFDPIDGFAYWMIMSFVFAACAIFLGWLQSKNRAQNFKIILREQSLHWMMSSIVVVCAFLVEKSDRIHPEDAGLVILLILSLACMIDGLRVGWRFSLVGLYLGISAVFAAFLEHFLWIEILIASFVVMISYVGQIWLDKKTQA
jgi:hypothetical protein